MSNERKTVLKEVGTIDIDDYLVKDVIANLTKMLELYGDNIKISKEQYEYDDGDYLALFKPTPETDDEMEVRIKQESYYKKLNEDSERATFERLQKKFSQ